MAYLIAGVAKTPNQILRVNSILNKRLGLPQELGRKQNHSGGTVADFRVLWLGDVNENLGGGMDDVEKLHDGGAVVRDGNGALVVVYQLVHPSGAQRRPHHISHRRARVYVAHQLSLSLRRVGSFFQ